MVRGPKAKEKPGSTAATVILDAATGLFLAAGFDGVSLEKVAQSAGLSRQTVYNLFGSKDALFREVVRRHWAAIRAETAVAFGGDRDGHGSEPAGVLRHFAEALLRFVDGTEQVAFTRLVVAESRRLPWIAEEFYRAGKEPIVEAFTEALTQMVGTGQLRCEVPEIASRQFLGLVQEFIIWPRVMGIGEALGRLPGSDVIIDEAIVMFLSRYGSTVDGPRGQTPSSAGQRADHVRRALMADDGKRALGCDESVEATPEPETRAAPTAKKPGRRGGRTTT